MLQYLHNHHVARWDHNSCAAAAAAGQLKCLKYARENGCSWNANTTAMAARYGHFHCLDYAYDTRAIFYMSIADHPDTHRLLRAACKQRPILIVKCALEFVCIAETCVVMWVVTRVILPVAVVMQIIFLFMFCYLHCQVAQLSAELNALL